MTKRDVAPRDLILATIRRSLGVAGTEAPRALEVTARLAGHPAGVVPARGQLPPANRLDLFARMVEAAAGTVERAAQAGDIPAAVAAFLRGHNLPLAIRHGDDPLLPTVRRHRARGPLEHPPSAHPTAAISPRCRMPSRAIAETGTLVLTSGRR